MKKMIILIAIYTVGMASVFAQTESDSVKTGNSFFRFNMKEKVSYEIRTGINVAILPAEISDFTGEKLRPGWNIGVLANLPFVENVYFQTGLFFSGKGAFAVIYNFESRITQRLHLELPFSISYRHNMTKKLKLEFNFGTYGETDFDDNFALGLIFGSGLCYKKWYYGIRYDLGLTNKDVGYVNDKDLHDRNSILAIMVGYRF